MKTIYKKDSYSVSVDLDRGVGLVDNGTKKTELRLVPAIPLPTSVTVALRKAGQNPADYAFVAGNVLRKAALPAWEKAIEESFKLNTQKAEAKERNIPGLKELRKAQEAEYHYDRRFRNMMEDENAVRAPTRPTTNVQELESKYPIAALYLQAEAYEDASNDRKSFAGTQAKNVLLQGGSIQEAKEILRNWIRS